jgi:hypothetical protein
VLDDRLGIAKLAGQPPVGALVAVEDRVGVGARPMELAPRNRSQMSPLFKIAARERVGRD